MNHDSKKITNDRHYTSTGYVYDRLTNRFLMVFHKKFQKWIPPGGHIKTGEEPNEAALREVYEETGLIGHILRFPNQTKITVNNAIDLPLPFCVLSERIPLFGDEQEHVHINFVYIVLIDQPFSIKLLKDEVSNFQWISLESIGKLDTFNSIRELCKLIYTALRENSKYLK